MKYFNFFSLWFLIWSKRLLLHPFFLFTLFLLPAASLFLNNLGNRDDAILRIAICIEGSHPDPSAKELKKELSRISNSTVKFYFKDSKKAVMDDVSAQKAVSGYILPADIEDKLRSYAKKNRPFITAIQHDTEMSNNIVNEILLSKLYKTHAFNILTDFLSSKAGNEDIPFLRERVKAYENHELLFRFEYADGTENKLLKGSTGLLLMPLRGLISILIFLSCMAGALTWYEDKRTGFSRMIPQKKQKLCIFFSLFVPGLFAGILGIFSLKMTEVSENIWQEGISMICFLFACISLDHFLLSIIKEKETFLSFLPIVFTGSLLLCPVFIDLSIYSPVIRSLRYLFPTHYYLRSLHSGRDLANLLLYGFSLLLLRKLSQRSSGGYSHL